VRILLGHGRHGRRTRGAPLALAITAAAVVSLPHPGLGAPATPQFVQVRAQEVTSGSTNSLAFNSANTAGNLIVVYAIWSNAGSASVSDSRGNAYATAAPRTTWGSNWSAQVFYAANVAAGANTVTAAFATAVSGWAVVYIHEYSGVATASPVDVSRSATGTGSAMSSGSATTTNANDLLVGLGASGAAVTQGATGWTARSTAYGNRTMDRNVTATGAYTATMTQNSNAWVLQLVAFKADPGETTPPTAGSFQNEVLATGFDLPTAVRFLPDGRMLVVELQGRIKVLPPPYAAPDATLFLQLTNVGSAGVQQGLYDIALDPGFTGNHFYYLFYTLGTPNRDRLSRFTANASLTGTVAGSERVLYQDPQDANAEHHGGAVSFGNDGKLYFTTGEHFDAPAAQSLSSPRGKVHRINPDGTVPTDNPFYDGTGPNVDSIWARGLRNPYRAFYDAPSGRLFVGDVGGNDNNTSKEEVDLGARGANYGWPDSEGPCSAPCTSPLYSYPHAGRDASVTGGFVYHGSQYPASYQGSYFFADYTQNWIRRLTFDAGGNVTGAFAFEPANGSVDGPYGDIVYLTEGPDGALYYVDLGYSDIGGTFGVSKIRRIRFVSGNQAPVASASANPTSGPAPLEVSFSGAGSSDPEGQPLTYQWTFGDGQTSTAANPVHTYARAGQYSARLSVSDGVNTTLSTPIAVGVGSPPTATILSPADGGTFRAGDVISFSGDATDPDDGALPASAFTWNVDFLHEGHVHPGTPVTGTKNGTFTIPTTGHDFSGNTRYRITLTVTDSTGLTDTKSVTIYPQKVNLTFETVPTGRTLYLDGIARTTPFTYDTLVGFNHAIEARNQTSGSSTYTFRSWSDGGAQQHTIVVPSTAQTYTATYTVTSTPAPIAFVQVRASTPQSPQSTVATTFTQAQTAGNLNVVEVGWNESTGNITSVTDAAGNSYQVAVPTFRGTGLSQAVYYARNVAAAGAGSNTVTVRFDKAVAYADVRILEYRGLDQTSPFDVGRSGGGTAAAATSGAVTTNFARELVVGAGITTACFTGAGSGFTARIITDPDCDISEDRTVTATGSYGATAPQTGTWIMQVAAFKGAGQ
jgi:glucose/arabinose dehydrogenase